MPATTTGLELTRSGESGGRWWRGVPAGVRLVLADAAKAVVRSASVWAAVVTAAAAAAAALRSAMCTARLIAPTSFISAGSSTVARWCTIESQWRSHTSSVLSKLPTALIRPPSTTPQVLAAQYPRTQPPVADVQPDALM